MFLAPVASLKDTKYRILQCKINVKRNYHLSVIRSIQIKNVENEWGNQSLGIYVNDINKNFSIISSC
jgi:hypothetical protein